MISFLGTGSTVGHRVTAYLQVYQKQSSCFFQAVSAQSTIHKNIFYNGPRAMVNFNDGGSCHVNPTHLHRHGARSCCSY